jgi:GNAT superfamily N-acetyltransferase
MPGQVTDRQAGGKVLKMIERASRLNVEFRAASVEDAEEMLVVQHAAYALREKADPPYQALLEDADDVASQIREGGGIVAMVGDRIVGSIRYREDAPGVLLGMRLAVHPEFQRQGIGSRLIRRLDEVASRWQCPTIHLHVRRFADHLIKMYARCGFEVVDDPADPDYNHPVYLVMARRLHVPDDEDE